MDLIDEVKIINGVAKISITIDNMGKVTLKHSKDVSKNAIENFVENKRSWIQKKKEDKINSLDKNTDILNYKSICIFDKDYKLTKTKRNRVEGNEIFFTTPKLLSTTIKKLAENEFKNRVTFYKNLIGVSPISYTLDNTRTRWGVCTSKKEIKINFRAVLLPKELFDYVIIHELCHLIQFNHSALYWQEVEKYCPKYKKYRQEIKSFSFLLEMFR